MDLALLLARLLLAAVFLIAGIAKLADQKGSREGMREFGLPASLAKPAAIMIPVAELVVAALLLPKGTAWWGALGALALLAIFLVAIGYNLARGRHPECHCFGQLHSQPTSSSTLVRNGILASVALFVVGYGRDLFSFSNKDAGASLIAWTQDLSAWELIVTIVGVLAVGAIVLQGWLLLELARQNGRFLLRLDALESRLSGGSPAGNTSTEPELEGLPVGTVAPPFALRGLHGETLTLASLLAPGRPVLLFFADPECGPCKALLPEIRQWQRQYAAALTIAVISAGSAQDVRSMEAEHGLSNVLLQKGDKVARAYQAVGTPTAVLITPDGAVGSPVAGGTHAIRRLVAESVDTQSSDAAAGEPLGNDQEDAEVDDAPERMPIGQPASDISLPDLSGRMVQLGDFRGRSTLVLFWSPSCGFCQHMLPDLRAWEAAAPPDAPQLLIVSDGTTEDNLEMRLRSPIVIDQRFATGWAYGVRGTPSAVMIDAEGNIASDVAEGSEAVMTLAGMTQEESAAA